MEPGSHGINLVARGGGLHPPAEVMKNWPQPNHIDPEERGWEAPVALAVMLGITLVVYALRMWARLVISKSAGIDDLLISLSVLPLIGLTIAAILAIRQYGFQWHVWDQTKTTVVTSRQITLAIELTYLASTTLIKISILCFYRRITGSLTNIFVYSTWASIVFCGIYGVLFFVLIIFICAPVEGFFHIYDAAWRAANEVQCYNEGAVIVACAAISTIQDLVICMLPIFLIWNLKITRRQRFALCGIFGLGLVTTICGILRTYYAAYVYYYTYDITYRAYYGWVTTVLEAQLGLIAASAPALKVFFQRYFKMSSSRAGYTAASSRHTPNMPSSNSRGYPLSNKLASQHSMTRSKIEGGGVYDTEVPLNGIKVSQGLDVHIEERDDISQKSYASTRNLTSGSGEGWGGKEGWIEGCKTVCKAVTSGVRDASRSRSRERECDAERGGPAV